MEKQSQIWKKTTSKKALELCFPCVAIVWGAFEGWCILWDECSSPLMARSGQSGGRSALPLPGPGFLHEGVSRARTARLRFPRTPATEPLRQPPLTFQAGSDSDSEQELLQVGFSGSSLASHQETPSVALSCSGSVRLCKRVLNSLCCGCCSEGREGDEAAGFILPPSC